MEAGKAGEGEEDQGKEGGSGNQDGSEKSYCRGSNPAIPGPSLRGCLFRMVRDISDQAVLPG